MEPRIIGKEKATLSDGREVDLAPVYIELLDRGTYTLYTFPSFYKKINK